MKKFALGYVQLWNPCFGWFGLISYETADICISTQSFVDEPSRPYFWPYMSVCQLITTSLHKYNQIETFLEHLQPADLQKIQIYHKEKKKKRKQR